jgi:triosephosphate isomerase
MAEKRRRLIAGNWKMNGLRDDGLLLAVQVAQRGPTLKIPALDLLICPPATLVALVVQAVAGSPIAVGGQDCHADASGAHTGDISAPMLADLGCRYVIVGHSERRIDHRETDGEVRAKAAAAHAAGLAAVVCIGESLAQRDTGQTLDVIAGQLAGSLPESASQANTVVAYEPVWAIGSGRNATVEQIAEAHAAIRRTLLERFAGGGAVRLLYGGSVKPNNAKQLFAVPEVDGALVGGASLKADDFLAIAAAVPS